MAFYVKLGFRGVLFRLGTLIVGVAGPLVYRRHYRKRVDAPVPPHAPAFVPER